MLSDICFKQIKDDYWLGQYGDFQVIMMKSCGWINVSKLCKDGGKQLSDWTRLEHTKRLIEALENQNGHQASVFTPEEPEEKDLYKGDRKTEKPVLRSNVMQVVKTFKITDVERLISGTYCHGDLIPHVACWISPVFALKVSRIINTSMIQEYKDKINVVEQACAAADLA